MLIGTGLAGFGFIAMIANVAMFILKVVALYYVIKACRKYLGEI
ncbi:hypothetical protein SAMN02745245_00711 [Anaerosphaera aminiphila DSM 21120]|uniref:Uncharacterized protein n=1 Tax=Anaerosphaera aminiphila DSM 21120 TaxID=1120995 RepID=A0A1M5QRQ6_9FIRM|nr:hypothetical protein [Anaerosphaera aminiphila]SHH16628.1 hypothetical protein SAMN02745245_00711 [Anaerosphaera aminiphila DSM 21120]